MLEHYYVKPSTIDRIRDSWLGSQIENYVGWMEANGYTSRTVFRRLPRLFGFAEFAQNTLAQGVLDTTGNIKVAQEILGHSHLTTTTDLYMKVDQNAMVSALAQAKASGDRSMRSAPSLPATQYAFAYDDETISELERAIAQAAGVEPTDGDS